MKIRECLTKNKRLAVSLGITLGAAAGSITLYVEGTAKSAPLIRASVITVNLAFSLLSGKTSIDHLLQRKDNKQILKLIVELFIAGAVGFAPALITALLDDSRIRGILFGIFNELGNTETNLFSISQIPTMYEDFKDFCRSFRQPKTDQEKWVAHLQAIHSAFQKGDLNEVKLNPGFLSSNSSHGISLKEVFEVLQNTVDTNKAYTSPFWKTCLGQTIFNSFQTFKATVGTATAALMLYGCSGYLCATEASLKQIGLESDGWAFGLANLLVSFLYILNIKGAFSLMGGLLQGIVETCKHKSLDNSFKLGGIVGKVTSLLAPIAAGFAYWSSSFSKGLFEDHCLAPQSLYPEALRFSWGADVVSASTQLFNGIYFYLTILAAKQGCVSLFGSEQDKLYLHISDMLSQKISAIKNMSADNFAKYRASDDGRAMHDFINTIITKSDEATLLINSDAANEIFRGYGSV